MTTLTIEIDDATYARLLREAEARSVDVETLVVHRLSEDDAVSADDEKLMDSLIEEYRPVFHRLAQ